MRHLGQTPTEVRELAKSSRPGSLPLDEISAIITKVYAEDQV